MHYNAYILFKVYILSNKNWIKMQVEMKEINPGG